MILNLRKPVGWTSFDVVAKTKGILHDRHVGHAGTLDPLAEGVLLVLTGKDTKQQDALMKGEKEYLTEVTFGITTPTYDLEMVPNLTTSISEIPEISKLEFDLLLNLPKFTGNITQEIPAYSAKKVNGKPLYKIARDNLSRGITDLGVLPTKEVTIYSITFENMYMKELETDKGALLLPTIVLRVICSHGTFIRALARDLGKSVYMDSVMTKLVRTRVGDYSLEDSIEITKLSDYLTTN